MSVFSEISDGLHLVVHSIISMVRGHNPNGSACNFLAIYCVILINMPIKGTIWSFFSLLLKLECIQGFCCNWLPQGGAAGVVSPLASINHIGFDVFWGHGGKIFQSSEAYLLTLFPPSFPKLDATLCLSFICCMLSATKQVNCNC